jgi:DNA (cytosine-5)-methyltransferase 1
MDYFSTFSGIGGFEKGIQGADLDWECVGYSEIDKYASAIYNYNYPHHTNYGDITAINESGLPDFDLFVGGFPCQAFSIAGKRQGFEDTRGTLFFDVARILSAKRPEWVVLENVKGLLNHDGGRTVATIFRVLSELGYSVGWEVVNSCQFGVPQNRERIFIIGHLREAGGRAGEIFPIRKNYTGSHERSGKTAIARTLTAGGNSGGMHSSMTLLKSGTWRTHKDGQGFRELDNSDLSPCIPARAREDGSGQPVVKAVLTPDRMDKSQNGRRFKKDGEPSFTLTSQDKHGVFIGNKPDFIPGPKDINKTVRSSGHGTLTAKHNHDHIYDSYTIRRLTPTECERLQGFPDGWTEFGRFEGLTKEISDTQRYKCLGNAVTTNVIAAIMARINEIING